MPLFFRATKKQVANIPISALAEYLQKFINTVFPENNICYWETNFPVNHMAEFYIGLAFNHAACYVKSSIGADEVIDIRIALGSDRFQQVIRAKSRGESDENWAIARAAAKVIDALYNNRELPVITDIVNALPSEYKDARGMSIDFLCSNTGFDVVARDQLIAVYDMTNKGEAAGFFVDCYLKGWERLVRNSYVHIYQSLYKLRLLGLSLSPSEH